MFHIYHLLASTLVKKLLGDIKMNSYYGILIDSTFDLGHRVQLLEVIQFVDVDFVMKKVVVKASFLVYIKINFEDAATFKKVMVEQLEFPIDLLLIVYLNVMIISL
jgi:hypothetical protein